MTIDIDAAIAWLGENWIWPAAIVAAIVVLILLGKLIPDASIATDKDFPVTGTEARNLAVGAIQLNTSAGYWNDPEARSVATSKTLTKRLVSMWGFTDRESWLQTMRELPERRTSALRDALLDVRAEWAIAHGRRPSQSEWIAEAKARGAGHRDAVAIIKTVVTIEKSFTKKKLGTVVLPSEATIANVRGYALGQQIAVATWGVALGFSTREEIQPILAEISAQAKKDFGSWEEFGRSFLLGRVLRNTEQGMETSDAIEKNDDGLIAYGRAFDKRRGGTGPWSTLQW